jgi:hypothetical protein
MSRTGYRAIAIAIVTVAVTLAGLYWFQAHNKSSANGTGLTYHDTFYWASGAEVRADALGKDIAKAVPFQDTTANLREIKGLDANVTVAAWLPMISSQVPRPAWILISTDQGRGTNPQAFPDTSAVLVKP